MVSEWMRSKKRRDAFQTARYGTNDHLFPTHFSFATGSFGNRDANGNGVPLPTSIRLGIGEENS